MQPGLLLNLLNGLGLAPVAGLLGPILDTVGPVLHTVDGVLEGIISPLPLVGPIVAPLLGGILNGLSVDDVHGNLTSSNTTLLPMSCAVEPYTPASVLSQTFAAFDAAKANIYRYRQQQSVNLGGWFVVEKWMTPSLFACAAGPQASEYDVASGWGQTAAARSVLERHWDSFITEDDIKSLAATGINTVRLPIGYWSLGPLYCQGTPYEGVADVYENSWSRVARAINWAGEAGMGVLIDLHGAPGSQNGQPHSGVSTGSAQALADPALTDKTMDILTFLVQQLSSVTNVVGIELLNEPVNTPELAQFYSTAITSLRQVSPAATNFPFYIHDAFNLKRFSDYVADRKDFVVQDHHSYFVFTPKDATEAASEHVVDVETDIGSMIADASKAQRRNLVIGEWSCALSPESLVQEADPASTHKAFCGSQMDTYANATAGWNFWSYKMEDCAANPGWCFQSAVGTLLPSTFFSYPQVRSPRTPVPAITPGSLSLPSMTEVTSTASNGLPMPTPAVANATHPKRSSAYQQHRFMAIHSRRRHLSSSVHSTHKRALQSAMSSPDEQVELTSTEKATAKGYTDGFVTAKIFAEYGWSRLGFTGQYVLDSIDTLGPTVVNSDQAGTYTQYFMQGLRDGEAAIMLALDAA